jgi:hypothetical protein
LIQRFLFLPQHQFSNQENEFKYIVVDIRSL